jgi:hypothetical protein
LVICTSKSPSALLDRAYGEHLRRDPVSLEDISDQISGASSAGADKALGLNNL